MICQNALHQTLKICAFHCMQTLQERKKHLTNTELQLTNMHAEIFIEVRGVLKSGLLCNV